MKVVVKKRLQQLLNANGGVLTPDAVIADAKKKDSPLHGEFQWDLKKAAYQHWLDQARELIRSVQIVIQLDEKVVSTVHYVRDPVALPGKQGYVELLSLRDDEDRAKETIAEEFARADAALQRAQTIALVLNFDGDVEEVRKSLSAAKSKLQQHQAVHGSPA